MKKSILIFALILGIHFLATAQTAVATPTEGGYTLTVNVEGLESNEGFVNVGLYNSEGTWLKSIFAKQKSRIKNNKATVQLTNIPEGTYAISSYHDQNEDDKLDIGWFGIPSEPYACSKGAVGRFGPPAWSDAVFTVDSDGQVVSVKF